MRYIGRERGGGREEGLKQKRGSCMCESMSFLNVLCICMYNILYISVFTLILFKGETKRERRREKRHRRDCQREIEKGLASR